MVDRKWVNAQVIESSGWTQVSAPPLSSSVTLGKFTSLTFFICTVEMSIEFTLQRFVRIKYNTVKKKCLIYCLAHPKFSKLGAFNKHFMSFLSYHRLDGPMTSGQMHWKEGNQS